MTIHPPVHNGATKRDIVTRAFELTASGSADEFAEVFHPDMVNREAAVEPRAARGPGPVAAFASATWLRTAFSELVLTVDEVVSDGDLTVTYGTMSGRHTGPFVLHDDAGRVERVFAPTGKTFTVTHSHWWRLEGDLVIEHWANRDDQGQGLQLGWIPPSPAYLYRCARATRKARRAVR